MGIPKDKLITVLTSFHKIKSLGPNWCTSEFYLGFIDLRGDYLIKVLEEVILSSKVID